MATQFKVTLLSDDARAPNRMSAGAAGYDLYSNADVLVPAHGRALVSTGIAIQIPPHTYARIAPRSSLALRGVDVGAGVVDADYRGEVKVLLINHSDAAFEVAKHARVAQLILEVIETPPVHLLLEEAPLDLTERGLGGFGSTGV